VLLRQIAACRRVPRGHGSRTPQEPRHLVAHHADGTCRIEVRPLKTVPRQLRSRRLPHRRAVAGRANRVGYETTLGAARDSTLKYSASPAVVSELVDSIRRGEDPRVPHAIENDHTIHVELGRLQIAEFGRAVALTSAMCPGTRGEPGPGAKKMVINSRNRSAPTLRRARPKALNRTCCTSRQRARRGTAATLASHRGRAVADPAQHHPASRVSRPAPEPRYLDLDPLRHHVGLRYASRRCSPARVRSSALRSASTVPSSTSWPPPVCPRCAPTVSLVVRLVVGSSSWPLTVCRGRFGRVTAARRRRISASRVESQQGGDRAPRRPSPALLGGAMDERCAPSTPKTKSSRNVRRGRSSVHYRRPVPTLPEGTPFRLERQLGARGLKPDRRAAASVWPTVDRALRWRTPRKRVPFDRPIWIVPVGSSNGWPTC